MAIGKDRAVGRQLRTLIHVGAIGDLSDGQLLERFATARGEAAELAFAALVERHGSMVLRVCRAVLDDLDASEDAFQATFLVLVTKGRSLWVRDSLGPWLHQVAHRTARCARSNAARRLRLERRASLIRSELEKRTQLEPTAEVERVLLEEIDRLPERFKAPVVLCDLEGRTHEAAARALGWPIGTVKSRQARARDRLREQLTRRGFAPGAGLAMLALPRLGPSIAVPLIDNTTALAVRFVASGAIAPGSAAWLAQEVIRSMSILRSVKIASILLAFGAAGSGAGMLAQGPGEGSRKPEPPQAQAEAKPPEKAQPPATPDDKSVFQVKPGKIEVTISERGTLEPWRSQAVLCEVEGRTTIIMIKPEGSKVTKGEVVAELDSALLRDTLVNQMITTQMAEAASKQARLVREVTEYAVKEYLDGILPSDQSRLKEKIAVAEQGLKEGEARLQRTRAARKKLDEALAATKGPATPSDIVADATLDALLEAAERSLADHKRDLETARKDQEILEKYTREKTTRKLQYDLEEAKAGELNKLGRWNAEKAKEKNLERQIERCTLKAPGDGMVLYAIDRRVGGGAGFVIEEGATVRERQILFWIFDPNAPMQVNVKVSEAMVDQVKPGMRATVTVDAMPNQTLSGAVLNVAPMADANSQFSDNRKVYTTRIKLDQAVPNLRPSMTAQATILIRALDNVLIVPVKGVFYPAGNNKPWVTVKTPEGKHEQRDVTVGASDGKFIEIKSGLKAGDLVVHKMSGGFQ